MTSALQVREPWYRRFWLRALALVTGMDEFNLGADFAGDQAQTPAYDPDSSTSAALVFPWPYACSRVRAASISRLPLRVFRWEQDGDTARRVYLDDHWLMGLSERPNSYTAGITFGQELQQDLDGDGNAYLVIVGLDLSASPSQLAAAIRAGRVSLHRLHPKRVKIVPATWGIQAYRINEGQADAQDLDPRLVLHVRRGSYRDIPQERFLGTGAVRPLTDLLTVEQAQAKRDKESAAKGRPSVMIAPADDKVTWSKEQRRDVREAYESMTRNDGGAVVLGGHAHITPFSFSPKDLASDTVRDANRTATLAAYRVPPVKVGLETANFATAREQDVVFWESIQDDAALHAWAWTELARRVGERDVYAELDTSGVHALSEWKTSALQRANTLWLMGFDMIDALRTQGLHEEAEVEAQRRAASKPKADAEEPRGLRLLRWWAPAREVAPPPVDEEARADRWRKIDAQLLAVGERELTLALREFLRDQGERVSDKLDGDRALPATHSREDVDQLLGRIWDDVAERRKLGDAARARIRAILLRAFEQGQADVGEDEVIYLADRIDQMTDDTLAELVVRVSDATKASLREIITTGLERGETIAEMQFRIMQSEGFSAVRALRIARTETTRSTSAGTVQAYQQAAPQLQERGIIVKKQWLSSRDDAVRDAHRDLDGQTVAPDGEFVVPPGTEFSGAHGSGPGDFSEAGMVVNCRCAVVPALERTA